MVNEFSRSWLERTRRSTMDQALVESNEVVEEDTEAEECNDISDDLNCNTSTRLPKSTVRKVTICPKATTTCPMVVTLDNNSERCPRTLEWLITRPVLMVNLGSTCEVPVADRRPTGTYPDKTVCPCRTGRSRRRSQVTTVRSSKSCRTVCLPTERTGVTIRLSTTLNNLSSTTATTRRIDRRRVAPGHGMM